MNENTVCIDSVCSLMRKPMQCSLYRLKYVGKPYEYDTCSITFVAISNFSFQFWVISEYIFLLAHHSDRKTADIRKICSVHSGIPDVTIKGKYWTNLIWLLKLLELLGLSIASQHLVHTNSFLFIAYPCRHRRSWLPRPFSPPSAHPLPYLFIWQRWKPENYAVIMCIVVRCQQRRREGRKVLPRAWINAVEKILWIFEMLSYVHLYGTLKVIFES